jgi:acetylornithine deacetylase/succinyl-diaminopimelate desuccinylase-like protein
MSLESVDSYLANARPRHLASLLDLLRIPSISAQAERAGDIQACAEWLKEHLEGIGAENVALLSAGGNPVVYGDWLHAPPGAPTVLVYGHYDVQPPEPLELWESPPFEPSIRTGRVFARGASDNKGQFFLYLMAFEALLQTEGTLPVNVKFLLDGEEELRSDHLAQFVTEQAELLRADFSAISDSGFFKPDVPGIITGLRGMAALNFTLRTAHSDLHSGGFGGTVPNALHAMTTLVAGLHSPVDGHVLVEGFYDSVRPLPESVREAWLRLPFDPTSFRDGLGLSELFGEQGFSPI